MTDILRRGLDDITLDGISVDPEKYQDVLGFEGQMFLVGVEAGILSVASAQREPQELELTYNQTVIARFAVEHTGSPFRSSDIINIGEQPIPKAQFNEAVFDKSTGLWTFFNDIAGYNNLWYRDRNTHQLGAEQTQGVEIVDEEDLLDEYDVALFGDLSDEQRVIMSAVRDLVPVDGIEEDELINQLCDLFPEHMPAQVKSLLHSSVHRIRNSHGSATFDFAVRGRGAQQRTVLLMDTSLSTAEDRPVSSNSTVLAESGTEPPHYAPRSTLSRQYDRRKAIGPNILSVSGDSQHYTDEEKLANKPIAWKISRDGFIVNGESVDVHPDVLQLVHCISIAGDQTIRFSDIATIFNGGRMDETQFKRFVVWANLAIDRVNEIAPVIVINNHGRAGRRDTGTTYRYNHRGEWRFITKYVQGTSLVPHVI